VRLKLSLLKRVYSYRVTPTHLIGVDPGRANLRDKSMIQMSCSQIGQDLQVAKFYANNSDKKYFVEVGAFDGRTLSNTYMLEKSLGWDGLCIEALPNMAALCQNNQRKQVVQVAVGGPDDPPSLTFDVKGVLSGLREYQDAHFGHQPSSSFTVSTRTLTQVLDAANAPSFLHYVSIDTEGNELRILQGFDFDRYQIGYLTIEHNYVEPRRSQMRELLLSKGYVLVRENQFDDDYALASTCTNTVHGYVFGKPELPPVALPPQAPTVTPSAPASGPRGSSAW
jgi:FkbM family methyltransferase